MKEYSLESVSLSARVYHTWLLYEESVIQEKFPLNSKGEIFRVDENGIGEIVAKYENNEYRMKVPPDEFELPRQRKKWK